MTSVEKVNLPNLVDNTMKVSENNSDPIGVYSDSVDSLEEKGLISSEEADILRSYVKNDDGTPVVNISSNPMFLVLSNVMQLALQLHSEINSDQTKISDLKLDEALTLAKELISAAVATLATSVVLSAASFAYSTKVGSGNTKDSPGDADAGVQLGPVVLSLLNGLVQNFTQLVQSFGQSNQDQGRAELDRTETLLNSIRERLQSLSTFLNK